MKITRKQLYRLITEISQDLNLSDIEVNAAKEKLEDEGGAAGPDMVIDAIKGADNTSDEFEKNLKDEDVIDALMKKDSNIVKHDKGDLVYKVGLQNEGLFDMFFGKDDDDDKEAEARSTLRRKKFKVLSDIQQRLKSGEITYKEAQELTDKVHADPSFKTQQQILTQLEIDAQKTRQELEASNKKSEKRSKMADLRRRHANLKRSRIDEKSIALPKGQFRLSQILGGDSGPLGYFGSGPEGEEEQTYLDRAKEAYDYLSKFDSVIDEAAFLQRIDPDLVYGILIDEYMRMYPRAFFDFMGLISNRERSVGIGQTQGGTAKMLTAKDYYTPPGQTKETIANMSFSEIQNIIASDDSVGINYVAAYLRYIEDEWQLGDKNDLLTDIEKDAAIAQLYSLGFKPENVRTPNPDTGYGEYKKGPPQGAKRGKRAASVMRALRGEDELVTESLIRKMVMESLEKIGFYKKYSYGLDDIPNKTKGHDAIVGHT